MPQRASGVNKKKRRLRRGVKTKNVIITLQPKLPLSPFAFFWLTIFCPYCPKMFCPFCPASLSRPESPCTLRFFSPSLSPCLRFSLSLSDLRSDRSRASLPPLRCGDCSHVESGRVAEFVAWRQAYHCRIHLVSLPFLAVLPSLSFLLFSFLFRLWYNGILVYVFCFLLFFCSAVEKGTWVERRDFFWNRVGFLIIFPLWSFFSTSIMALLCACVFFLAVPFFWCWERNLRRTERFLWNGVGLFYFILLCSSFPPRLWHSRVFFSFSFLFFWRWEERRDSEWRWIFGCCK